MEKSNEQFADLWEYVDRHEDEIEKTLREHLPVAPPTNESEFQKALDYALFSSGKNVRPVLTLLGAELFGGKGSDMLPAAAAVEYVHTSSQIFDELPFIGNKSYGKPPVHRKFGMEMAVLAALGLLNAAYPLVFVNHAGMPERAMQAHGEIVECVGAAGLVGGRPTKGNDGLMRDSFGDIKTSALMRLALRVGAILAGADYPDLANVSRFAELFGDAYGLSVDLASPAKRSGIFSDEQAREAAAAKLSALAEEAKTILVENFSSTEARSCLIQITEFLAEKKA